MPRTRYIKHAFFTNEDIARCSKDARLLFIGLWTVADREGRLEERPATIKAELFPFEDGIDIPALLDELAAPKPYTPEGFIRRYQVGGRAYIQINNFDEHQNPHKNETASKRPAPPEDIDHSVPYSTQGSVHVPSDSVQVPINAEAHVLGTLTENCNLDGEPDSGESPSVTESVDGIAHPFGDYDVDEILAPTALSPEQREVYREFVRETGAEHHARAEHLLHDLVTRQWARGETELRSQLTICAGKLFDERQTPGRRAACLSEWFDRLPPPPPVIVQREEDPAVMDAIRKRYEREEAEGERRFQEKVALHGSLRVVKHAG